MDAPKHWVFKLDHPVAKALNVPSETDHVRMTMVEIPVFQAFDANGKPCGSAMNDAFPCPPFCP